MAFIYFYFFLLNVFITSITGYIIGESCRYDSDCFVENSYCLKQEMCECKENFLSSSDGRFCVATIGAICNSKHDCSTLPNSICYEENCLCDRGFVPDPHNMNCKPVSSGLKGPCEFSSQCYPKLGEYSSCVHGQCECSPGYVAGNGKCIKTLRLREPCLNDTQCIFKNGTHQSNNTACIDHVCQCKPGFRETYNGDCISGGISTSIDKFLLISAAIVSIEFPCKNKPKNFSIFISVLLFIFSIFFV